MICFVFKLSEIKESNCVGFEVWKVASGQFPCSFSLLLTCIAAKNESFDLPIL